MFMEAVRLSLASEENRKRKEEKALRKEAKKREKEEKKAAKKQARSPYEGSGSGGASGSSLSLHFGRKRGNSATSQLRMEATVQGATQVSKSGDSSPTPETKNRQKSDEDVSGDKGKGVDRGQGSDASTHEANSPFGSLPIPTGRGGSHLRQISNASSLGSSSADTPSGSYTGQGYQGPEGASPRASGMSVSGHSEDGDRDTGSEPMFNFRSLAEIVGVNIDDGSARQDDDGAESPGKTQTSTGRPLSQVDEDEKAEAEAEHVEERRNVKPTTGEQVRMDTDDQAPGRQEDESPAGLTTNAEVSVLPQGATPEDKQLGHSVAEQPSQVMQ